MRPRIDHALAFLLLVCLVVVAVVVLVAMHDLVPDWLETVGSSALVGAGVAVIPGRSDVPSSIVAVREPSRPAGATPVAPDSSATAALPAAGGP